MPEEKRVEDVLKKYKRELDVKINKEKGFEKPIKSREYTQFKREYLPAHMNWYESGCNYSEKIFKIQPDPKKAKILQEYIDVCHLNITPGGATSFALLFPMALMLFGSLIGYMIPMLLGSEPTFFFVFFFMLVGVVLMAPLSKLPEFMANSWRMKASNQMVICVFYIVTYMRHTSNIENAIGFASEHLAPPLSLDMKKVIWDVENEKYASVKESLDNYLVSWRKWNREFIESMHLVESSLYESSEDRRINALEKALDVILNETYEKMLHYAHNLKGPVTMLHMMGIIMPILGLVILPLVVSFMEGITWYHLATFYNVALPIMVYYMGKVILSKRPSGYGASDISEENNELKKYKKIIINYGAGELHISPLYLAFGTFMILIMIGLSPLIIHGMSPAFDIPLGEKFWFLEYRPAKNNPELLIGPYGLGASILSLFVPAAFGIGIGLYFMLRTKNLIKIRDKTKKLEQEFASGLFQLGNRLGDGMPVEMAFGRVSEAMEGTVSGNFFRTVDTNIRKFGMGVNQALFDHRNGALIFFPSKVIESSMKVLIESSKKGTMVASQALMNVARYIKEIHKVNERLKDLMGDIISSMKSQISFLTPVISGIVVGITSMITTILGNLSKQMAQLTEGAGQATAGIGGGGMLNMFGDGIPTYYFQLIVGIYVVEIIYILTVLSSGIENGADKLNENFWVGKNMIKSTITYMCYMYFGTFPGSSNT